MKVQDLSLPSEDELRETVAQMQILELRLEEYNSEKEIGSVIGLVFWMIYRTLKPFKWSTTVHYYELERTMEKFERVLKGLEPRCAGALHEWKNQGPIDVRYPDGTYSERLSVLARWRALTRIAERALKERDNH